jgi:hypothetical protein
MGLEHLTDEQIQDYVDGNLTDNSAEIKQHMESCQTCQNELAKYKVITSMLSEDIGFELSPNFISNVVSSVEEEGAEKFLYKISHVIMWAAGILAGIAVLIRFTDIEKAFSGFAQIGEQGKGITATIASAFSDLFASTDMNFNLIGMAALVLVGIFLVDRLIARARKNATTAGCLI